MNPDEFSKPPRWGKYKAFVRDNADPQKRGRIRCFCPQIMGPMDDTNHWLDWAEPCLPWLGGLNLLDSGPPNTKAQEGADNFGVWIEFEGGDEDFPIWVGTFTVAPSQLDPRAQQDLSQVVGATGGDIVDNPPPGSSVGPLDPPAPLPGTREVRLSAKAGVDIIFVSDQGGSLILGPSGAHLSGTLLTVNGRAIQAMQADKVTD